MTGAPPLLEVRGLDAFYGDAQALAKVSIEVFAGDVVSIVGANGAGKTTLIRAIAGMIARRTGAIRYRGRNIIRSASDEIAELGLGQVAEGRQIFPDLTVEENLDLGAILRRARARRRINLARAYELFPRLAERRRQLAGTLSGGEQQMLAIGRCLMAEPEFIMFDEPSLGLAPRIVIEIFDVIRGLNQAGLTLLLVEQNVEESLLLCNRAYVLENGEIVLAGTGEDLLRSDRIRQAYLGL